MSAGPGPVEQSDKEDTLQQVNQRVKELEAQVEQLKQEHVKKVICYQITLGYCFRKV